ncbi:MAG: Glutamate carboxypeptidase [Bryobacterales bacterium]|nr:Glutamate carboxypeptidase [Bryobacterales bacterium]
MATALGATVYSASTSTAIRGFDTASLAAERKWEKAAQALPEPARLRRTMEKIAGQAHLAGTPQSKETADYLLAQLREYGLEAHLERYEALLPQPKTRALEMTVGGKTFSAKLAEPAVEGDKGSTDSGMIPSFNAYSGDGDVTAPLVYVNYGVPADYDTLKAKGIDVKGKIVIARYGGSWRGIKPKVAAEHGAVGCIIYSDPRDDGYFQGDSFPKGAFRPLDGVQRGSVMDMVLYPGDPLSPGWASEEGAKRLSLAEAITLMKIPVLPISANDARPLLENLDGPVAPEAWRGALPMTYHMGPGTGSVHLKIVMDNATRPLYDVIATIPGSESPDQWIMFGNHHDAWVHGADDPVSGVSAQLETARTLAQLTRQGWKPKRTIMIAFWDAEEYGLIGSTEFMEKHADELNQKLIAYINSDSTGSGRISAGGSHSLETFVKEILRDVKDPKSEKSLLETAIAPRETPRRGGADNGTPGEFHLTPLGSGSDYTPFLQHLGVAALNIGFEGEGGGVYHSNYDDIYWYTHFSDKDFTRGAALAQVTATAVLRLANAPVLPFEFSRVVASVNTYLDEIEKLPNQKTKLDLLPVRTEVRRLLKSSAELDKAYGAASAKLSGAQARKLAAINQLLFQSERKLTLDPGLPGRPWFRHRIYAPGMYTGYAVKTLPGIREAVELNQPGEAVEQARQVVQVLGTLSSQIEQAAKLLGAL